MNAYTVLAPGLDVRETRLLRVMLNRAGLWDDDVQIVESWAAIRQATSQHYVLSVGRAGIDAWHEFGLIQVGAHHGCTFEHDYSTIMVLHHPGTLLQQSLVGHEAKGQMMVDLLAWRGVLDSEEGDPLPLMTTCAPCLKSRDKRTRRAEFWEPRLDNVGLCDDHYRRRAQLTRRPKPRIEKSSRAAQIKGQGEMCADGQHIIVAKS